MVLEHIKINNMNTPISFPSAELLKEKGYPFDFITIGDVEEVPLNIPTISDVVMWLYEKHGIWVWVERFSTLFRPYAEEIGDERFGKWEGHKYNSPTEAYEAAILYTLNNLI